MTSGKGSETANLAARKWTSVFGWRSPRGLPVQRSFWWWRSNFVCTLEGEGKSQRIYACDEKKPFGCEPILRSFISLFVVGVSLPLLITQQRSVESTFRTGLGSGMWRHFSADLDDGWQGQTGRQIGLVVTSTRCFVREASPRWKELS